MNTLLRLRPGMTVKISVRADGRNTRDNFGWETAMEEFLGTSQKILNIDSGGICIRFENNQYNWHVKDLELIDGIDEVKLQGKKYQFDTSELI